MHIAPMEKGGRKEGLPVPGAGPTRHPCSLVIIASTHKLQARVGIVAESQGMPSVSWHGKGSAGGSVLLFLHGGWSVVSEGEFGSLWSEQLREGIFPLCSHETSS